MRMTTLARQRGMSLVELMVGITVGLIVTAAASMVAVNQITEHRRLMLETQLQQDLRSAGDLIQQDIRRAGFRGLTGWGVWAPASGVGSALEVPALPASANNFTAVAVSGDKHTLTYQYARNLNGAKVDEPQENEHFGVQWRPGTKTLYLLIGKPGGAPNWQPITDPDIIEITDFNVELVTQTIPLEDFCDCVGSACTSSPQQEVRRVNITMEGHAKHDSQVVRSLSVTQKLRADNVTGSCS
ncbi:MAG: prepilin-type N-terminal cleavage/methylation domain-containing protein [Burkholderiales bacterium]|nr:MAG: prepilin-type N-terminal cleavage/methylation domain-containing protein [Burkholderiales bacterium]